MVEVNEVAVDENVIEVEATMEKKTIKDKIVNFGKRNKYVILAGMAVAGVIATVAVGVVTNLKTEDDLDDAESNAEPFELQ